jgi:predicted AlkP superfamily phosphohydrolase/phosphomutase
MRRIRKLFAALVLLGLIAWGVYTLATRVPVRDPGRKVVVIGFDGADPRLCRDYMEQGLLPNLSKLAGDGVFTELGTTIPSMSPVSWSSFAVGGNPGKHGIYDFLTRTPQHPTYMPSPESFVGQVEARFFHGIPYRMPRAINLRGGAAFWDYAAEDGIKTALFLVPVTFAPPKLPNGLALAGLGVPDLCGTQATYFYATNDPAMLMLRKRTEFGGSIAPLKQEGKSLHSRLLGPPSPVWKQERARLRAVADEKKSRAEESSLSREERRAAQEEADRAQTDLTQFLANPERLSMPIEVTPQIGSCALVKIDEEEKLVTQGKWSDWYRVKFQVTPLIAAHGICKVMLHSVSPSVSVYVSPIEISPEKPPVSICHPGSYCQHLVDAVGLFKTRGWAADSAALKEGFIDEEAFMSDIFEIMDKRLAMALETLQYDDWNLFVGVFSSTDRVSHMMWRLIDPEHPLYDEEQAKKYGDSIQKVYVKMDEIVGKIREKIDETTTDFYVISDHGFRSFRKGVNLNTFLSSYGPAGNNERTFMKLRGKVTRQYNLDDLFSGNSDFFKTQVYDPIDEVTRSEYYVEWKDTKAFALGLASVFINLEGRETQGMVKRSDYDAVCQEIKLALESLVDPETGGSVVKTVYKGTEIYDGPYAGVEKVTFPDLMVGYEEGYRTGWQSTLGGIGESVVEPNLEKWSGDHCGVDPTLTPGILFSNRRFQEERAEMIDMAPTILSSLGVDHPKMDGKDLRPLRED